MCLYNADCMTFTNVFVWKQRYHSFMHLYINHEQRNDMKLTMIPKIRACISIILMIIFTAVLITSCEKTETNPSLKDDIYGFWSEPDYNDSVIIFTRTLAWTDNAYGMAILPNQVFKERKNSGWCGTPPISYSDYEGSWVFLNDSILSISVGFWGGTAYYKWHIEEVTSQTLTIKMIEQEYPISIK